MMEKEVYIGGSNIFEQIRQSHKQQGSTTVGGGAQVTYWWKGEWYRAVVPVRWQRVVDGGTELYLISHKLYPIDHTL